MAEQGIRITIEDADTWIPNETGPKPDSKVTPRLLKLAKDYDVVHAFGYRCAWACGAAFKSYSAWFYTAYDMPKTTHELLIDKLNEAQAGICSSRAVYRALDSAIAIDLVVEPPGVDLPQSAQGYEARTGGRIVVAALGRLVSERGLESLIPAMEHVWTTFPDCVLRIGGTGPQAAEIAALARRSSRTTQIELVGAVTDLDSFYAQADVVAVPSRRAGTSMVALEAMARSRPVLLRSTGGLPELIEPDVSGMLFEDDDSLGETLSEMLSLPLTRQTLAGAGRVRVEERFAMADHAESIAALYKGVME